MLRYLLMEKCRHANSRQRKRYAFDLFKAVTRNSNDEVMHHQHQQASFLSGRETPHNEPNETLNHSSISAHNRTHSRHLSKSGEIALTEKNMDWYEIFWAK